MKRKKKGKSTVAIIIAFCVISALFFPGWFQFCLTQGVNVNLIRSIRKTEDTSPREEMGERSGTRETHGTMSLRERERERERVRVRVSEWVSLTSLLSSKTLTHLHCSVHNSLSNLWSHHFYHCNLLLGCLYNYKVITKQSSQTYHDVYAAVTKKKNK